MTNRLSNYETNKKPCFDIDESMGIGAISDKHLQEFFKFIIDKGKADKAKEVEEKLENVLGRARYFANERESFEDGADVLWKGVNDLKQELNRGGGSCEVRI